MQDGLARCRRIALVLLFAVISAASMPHDASCSESRPPRATYITPMGETLMYDGYQGGPHYLAGLQIERTWSRRTALDLTVTTRGVETSALVGGKAYATDWTNRPYVFARAGGDVTTSCGSGRCTQLSLRLDAGAGLQLLRHNGWSVFGEVGSLVIRRGVIKYPVPQMAVGLRLLL